MGKRQGKGARAKAKERRKNKKRADKEARQDAWQKAAARGANKKKKKGARKKGFISGQKHTISNCGNLGCSKCNSGYSDPMLAKPNTVLYSKRWSSKKTDV